MATLITISRFPLLIAYILMLYFGSAAVRLLSVPLLFTALMLDTVDGVVARRQNKVSLVGSVLDIAADRVFELVLWVALADLGAIPVAVPLIVITRTTLTDALRSIGVQGGKAPFDQHRSRLARFLVRSAWMRSGYSISKILAFCGLTLGLALNQFQTGTGPQAAAEPMLAIFRVVAWIAVVFCIIRGLPVILSGYRRVREPQAATDAR
ncbi:MAG TPA: CDP-alcohol phosphatidyltransferase family protein [Anaerolineales bacterium]